MVDRDVVADATIFARELLREGELLVLEGFVAAIGGAEILEIGKRGAVADFLEDERLDVEEPGCRHARVLRLRIDLPLAHQGGLQKVHLGRVELLENRGELFV